VSPLPRPPWLPLVAAAVVVPSVLAGLTLLWPRPQIESALTERAQAALSAAGISGATVRFDGRDATITGLSGDAAARAGEVVSGATGVRVASVGGGAGPASPTPTSAAVPTSVAPSAPTSVPTSVPTSAPTSTSAPAGQLDPAAKKALQARIAALVATTPVTFNPNSPQLTAQGSATLAQVLTVVRAAPTARLELDGYVAPGRGNGLLDAQQLSDQRAVAVRDAMVAAGVPADHLTARGRGEDTTATDRALARRVDITVV
jgi:outer membrane protein OmpA-like peptidoglycan-associated protein